MFIGGTGCRSRLVWLLAASLLMMVCRGAQAQAVPSAGDAQPAPTVPPEMPNYSQFSGAPYAPFSDPGGQCPDLGVPPTPTYWVNSSYLLWFMKKQPINVPVVSDGNTELFGNQSFGDGSMNGLRLNMGSWWDEAATFGGEVSFLAVFEDSPRTYFTAQSSVLERPYIDVASGLPKTFPIANGVNTSGSITSGANGNLFGGEANFLSRIYRNHEYESVDLILGYRNLDLLENIGIGSITYVNAGTAPFAGQTVAAPATINVSDAVKTTNYFNGAQIGARAQTGGAGITFSAYGKLALGVMDETVTRTGYTTALGPSLAPTFQSIPGGFLVNRDNSGSQSHSFFAVIPEIGLNAGIDVTAWMSLGIGYSFFYVTNVARPGDQLSPFINSKAIPSSPNFQGPQAVEPNTRVFQTSDYWVQGLNFTVKFRF